MGPGTRGCPTTRSQPGAERQHHVSRVSVSAWFQGYMSSAPSGGLAGKASQRARYGAGAGESSSVRRPVYVVGAAQGLEPPSLKSQTSTK